MRRKLGLILVALLVIGLVALIVVPLFRPKPIKVEAAKVTKGVLQVTVTGEGKTRVRDRFTVAAPVAGRLARIQLRRGDRVSQGAPLARIDPMPLAPLDPRQRAEGDARVRAAEATRREADAQVDHLNADLDQACRERERAEQLVRAGVISRQELEQKQNAETTVAKDLEAARFRSQSAAHDVDVARSALLTLDTQRDGSGTTSVIRAPINGQVLRVFEESERVITAGTPLLELSNPSRLEVVVDLLSTDAVKVNSGARVLVDGWGGQENLEARVRLVEPSAFTKVSALGIEEQRVNLIADFVGSTGPLGDAYRVEAHVVIWENDGVVKVPTSALFRTGEKWSVFVIEGGRAHRREIEVGQRTSFEVEVLGGLEDGAEVIVHPSNQISDGVSVEVQRDPAS